MPIKICFHGALLTGRRLSRPLACCLMMGAAVSAADGPPKIPDLRNPSFKEACPPGNSNAAMGIIVPAYIYPGMGRWPGLEKAARRALKTDLIAIANPYNGPGEQIDPNYTEAINSLRSAGGRVIGYVHTSYERRPIEAVKKDVELWYGRYRVDGIFIDETPAAASTYYDDLFEHIQKTHRSIRRKKSAKAAQEAVVVYNPGTYERDNRYPVGEKGSVCIFENSKGAEEFLGGLDGEDPSRHCLLAYAVSHENEAKAIVDAAAGRGIGWVYVTDDGGRDRNPWDSLPAYFQAMAAYIAACNSVSAGQTSAP